MKLTLLGVLMLLMSQWAFCGSHFTEVQWAAPVVDATHVAPTGYNVFRGTAPGVSTIGVPLAVLPATALLYDDSTANVLGQQYCYVIQSFDAAGDVSNSNEACGTLPFPPAAVSIVVKIK